MPSNLVILSIANASDGTDATPNGSKEMRRNDGYFLNKIAERWMQETKRAQPGLTYRLEKLPAGYRGYERERQGTKHIDRYLYGHPNGIFRSLNELFPHFKHLQDHEDSRGCTCKLCSKSTSGSVTSSGSSRKARNISPATAPATKSPSTLKAAKGKVDKRSSERLLDGRLSTSASPFDSAPRKKQVDEEGIPDVYRTLIDKLKAAGPDGAVDEDFADVLSPDWRVGHDVLQGLLSEWQNLPSFIPRLGEIVLFPRSAHVGISWDTAHRTFLRTDTRQPVVWEAGVVTQTPTEPLSEADLLGAKHQKKNVTYFGFRVEPLSEVGNEYKPFTTQHKYVPLHAIRPFSLWKECVRTERPDEWHPTVKHAMTVASSFCVLGKYRFKGTWPEATLFAKSVFVGSELIMLGDVIKLAPLEGKTAVTDVMHVTSIRLRFVKLDRASDDDYDDGSSYLTVLHFGGKAFTLDPKRSFAGIAKSPVEPGQYGLPAGLAGYGQWFHIVDPAHEKARLEVPFHRVLGRCHIETAMRAWFATGVENGSVGMLLDLSQSLASFNDARSFSVQGDARIKPGKKWFWADTRIEQLDLHEVNGRFVGPKDEMRSPKQVNAWAQALKVLDGKKGGVESYYAAQEKRQEEQKRREDAAVSSFGMMAAAGEQVDSGTDAEKAGEDAGEGEGDAMEVDNDRDAAFKPASDVNDQSPCR